MTVFSGAANWSRTICRLMLLSDQVPVEASFINEGFMGTQLLILTKMKHESRHLKSINFRMENHLSDATVGHDSYQICVLDGTQTVRNNQNCPTRSDFV